MANAITSNVTQIQAGSTTVDRGFDLALEASQALNQTLDRYNQNPRFANEAAQDLVKSLKSSADVGPLVETIQSSSLVSEDNKSKLIDAVQTAAAEKFGGASEAAPLVGPKPTVPAPATPADDSDLSIPGK